jgi:hypothetical protein
VYDNGCVKNVIILLFFIHLKINSLKHGLINFINNCVSRVETIKKTSTGEYRFVDRQGLDFRESL